MKGSTKYESASTGVPSLDTTIPQQLVNDTNKALSHLRQALCNDVTGYVAKRLNMTEDELSASLSAEQVDGVALALYNIEMRSQAVIIGDQTGIGKGRQAAAMIRYGLKAGYLPIFFTDRYTLFSDMYRDCKALGIGDARPLVVNKGVCVVDFDRLIDKELTEDLIWTLEEDEIEQKETEVMSHYQSQYETVYKAPTASQMDLMYQAGDIRREFYDYLMITYSQLQTSSRDDTRLQFLLSLCQKHKVLFIFDEAHRSSSVSNGKISTITECVNKLLSETPATQCIFLSATFAKRSESFFTFMNRTTLGALATESTLREALHNGGIPMQEFVSASLAAEGQMVRREHSNTNLPIPTYTYLDDDIEVHSILFDKVMEYFRDIVELSDSVAELLNDAKSANIDIPFTKYPARRQLFYINKVLLLSLKATQVARLAVEEVREGRSVVIGMSDTLECILNDVEIVDKNQVRGDFSALLYRLLEKTVCGSAFGTAVFDIPIEGDGDAEEALRSHQKEIRQQYLVLKESIPNEVFHLPMSPIDVIRQLITVEKFKPRNSRKKINIRFEECTGRAHQLEYLSPEGDDDYINAKLVSRKRRHSNHIYNDFQNNLIDVILINACGAIGASAHAVSTAIVPEEEVRQRKMLIIQNDLDVNIDLQKRGRINRTGQISSLPPLYEYVITAIPSEKRLNMMLRGKLRSLSANTAAFQDQDKDQADFIDIDNKYGNIIAKDYLKEHPDLQELLGIKSNITASIIMARMAMLSVSDQQEIVDDMMSSYNLLESELRRINQWDLEREYRDFEAEFVKEEIFTSSKSKSRLGGNSYLGTYLCQHITFPYSADQVNNIAQENRKVFGSPYKKNDNLQREIQSYYSELDKKTTLRCDQRQEILKDNTFAALCKYINNKQLCHDLLSIASEENGKEWEARCEGLLSSYVKEIAIKSSPKGKARTKATDDITDSIIAQAKAIINQESSKGQSPDKKQFSSARIVMMSMRKLRSFRKQYLRNLKRLCDQTEAIDDEKRRLQRALLNCEIGDSFQNIAAYLNEEETPEKVSAVLLDIRFGKDMKNRFLPSKVEFVFALTAVRTELIINLVHNKKYSNFNRLISISQLPNRHLTKGDWNNEIAKYNNRIIERTIITGNILGAFANPAIRELQPRFITFSLKPNKEGEKKVMHGLLLTNDKQKLNKVLNKVSMPITEALKHANNTNTSYSITGMGVNFSLLPVRSSKFKGIRYLISIDDGDVSFYKTDKRFDSVRPFFIASPIRSQYNEKGKTRHFHYATEALDPQSHQFTNIMELFAKQDAMMTVPRSQLTLGDIGKLESQAEIDDNANWPQLDWVHETHPPVPPIPEQFNIHIETPKELSDSPTGMPVEEFSPLVKLAIETLECEGYDVHIKVQFNAVRGLYFEWDRLIYHKKQDSKDLAKARKIRENIAFCLSQFMGEHFLSFQPEIKAILTEISKREFLVQDQAYIERFYQEMLFQSPAKETVEEFMRQCPYSPKLKPVYDSLQEYLKGKTPIIVLKQKE